MNIDKEIIELNKKYWNNIIPMADKHNIEPWKLVKIDRKDKKVICHTHPEFGNWIKRGSTIEFAISVIENNPVFQFDTLYSKFGMNVRVNFLTDNSQLNCDILNDDMTFDYNDTLDIEELTWKQPGKDSLVYTEYPFSINCNQYDTLIGLIERMKKIDDEKKKLIFKNDELKLIKQVLLEKVGSYTGDEYRTLVNAINKIFKHEN